MFIATTFHLFFHQTTRLMNSSTQLVPGQRLDSAFFGVDIVYGVDQWFSKCQSSRKKKRYILPYFPDCKVTFFIYALIYTKVTFMMLLMSNNLNGYF